MLPTPAPDIQRQYERLINDLARQIKLIQQILDQRLNCRLGCAACCLPFSVFALEAAMIAKRVSGLTVVRPMPGVCVFLENGLCRIYPFRPIICRSQGLPLAYADAERQCLEVSACLINFPEGTEFALEELLFLDEINRRLAALNIDYCRRHRLDAERRLALAEIL
jgi:Fe-S-cluster containining protein